MPRKTVIRPDAVKEDKLEDADGNTGVSVEQNSNEDKIRFMTAGNERMIILENGRVGINTSSPNHDLDVSGEVHASTGSFDELEVGGHSGYSLPASQGSNGQVLTANGAGLVTFEDAAAATNFIQGHVALEENAKPVNWHNVVSIGMTANQIKSWCIVPFSGTLTSVILSVRGTSFSTATDGNISMKVFLNQASFGTAAAEVSIAADSFSTKVSGFDGGNNNLYSATYGSLNLSVAAGDLIQIVTIKDGAGSPAQTAVVTACFS